MDFNFEVNGITFLNENKKDIQVEIDKMLKWSKKNGYIDSSDLWEGYTNKEILEEDANVGEFVGYVYGGKIMLDKYKDKDCFKVYVHTDNNEYLHIGYVPKELIEEIKEYYVQDDFKQIVVCTVKGGRYKYVDENFDGDDYIATKELNYGFNIKLSFRKYD